MMPDEIPSVKKKTSLAIKAALPVVQKEQSDGATLDGDPRRRRNASGRSKKEIGDDGG
ncbi:MAG TPA: hypothetical protein VF345_14465 [Chthoniobacterales bacterium]|jgi:hypothetical protein